MLFGIYFEKGLSAVIYGLPYTGSKNTIAETILNLLPSGDRLVDLFGGGGAITHCAALSGKYREVMYNEKLPMIADCFKRAIYGEFRDMEPRWIDREEFFRLRGTDWYATLCFSFSCNMENYIGGKEKEREYREDFEKRMKDGTIDKCHIRWYTSFKRIKSMDVVGKYGVPIEVTCGDYKEYTPLDGDVVYCDPPYNTESSRKRMYGGFNSDMFNFDEFNDWVDSRDYQVYVSSYKIPDDRFVCVAEIPKASQFKGSLNSRKITEVLYTQKRFSEGKKVESYTQIHL